LIPKGKLKFRNDERAIEMLAIWVTTTDNCSPLKFFTIYDFYV
jgi:hypothetical protein